MRSVSQRLALVTALIAVAGGVVYWQSQRSSPTVQVAASPVSPSVAKKSGPPLQATVRKIVEEGPSMPYLKFNYLIKELPTDLAPHDIDALIGFIEAPNPGGFGDGEWGSLVNDIEEALSVQTVPSAKVADALIGIYRDETKIQMQRDYALQHIGGFAMYLVHTCHIRQGTLPEFFPRLVEELKSATTDASKPWAGTAFNMLDGLMRAAAQSGQSLDDLTPGDLVARALPIAENPAAPLNARLPALQFASRHQSTQALNLARRILADPQSHLMLVQSACAVLGEHGGPNDIAVLESLIPQNNPHRAIAARAALARIHSSASTR